MKQQENSKVNELKRKIGKGIDYFKVYWDRPPQGRYMSVKEITSLSGGGFGAKFVISILQAMILSTTNQLIGNTIGIDPNYLLVIYVIGVLASIPLGGLRAKMIDSARNIKGKYRPYILSMGLPSVILGIGFVWMPYESMTLIWKCIVVLAFNIGFQFFFNFYSDAYASIVNVLSPNTIERSDVTSIRGVVDSLAPSILNIFMPIFAKLITGQNTLYDMKIYRIAYPPLLIAGFLLSLVIYRNTHEKIIQAKTHVVGMKFIDAFRSVARNKYFWILSLAGWLGFLEGAVANLINWMYQYQGACTAAQLSLITTIAGNACLWPMLFAPFLIRSIGKRKLLIISNLLNIVFILIMYFAINGHLPISAIWLMLFCTAMNNFVGTLGNILNPSLNADIRDYQQYITGERIDGMFVAVGLIGSVITLATSFVLPQLYTASGINDVVLAEVRDFAAQHPEMFVQTAEFKSVYDVLYHPDYFRKIATTLIFASVVGAVMNVIPMFFYDLTETKQRAMVTVLKIRALFEDYGNNALSDEALVEAIDVIDDAVKYSQMSVPVLSKTEIKAARVALRTARKSNDSAAISAAIDELNAAKADYRTCKQTIEGISIAPYVLKEVNRFNSAEGDEDIRIANMFVEAGLSGIYMVTGITLENAKALPKTTREEKEYRIRMIDKARTEIYSKKTIDKYYPKGLVEYDSSIIEQLFESEDRLDEKLRLAYIAYKKAKSEKDANAAALVKEEIKHLHSEISLVKKQAKKAINDFSIYNRAAKPYLDAVKVIAQKENYSHYDDIRDRYEESKARAEQNRIEYEAKIAREKAEKEAQLALLKEEKKALAEEKKAQAAREKAEKEAQAAREKEEKKALTEQQKAEKEAQAAAKRAQAEEKKARSDEKKSKTKKDGEDK